MGSRVNVCSINFLNNPAAFTAEFNLEITFEVFEHLPHDLEWELVYVASGESTKYDQVLDSVLIGPTPEGKHKFVFTAACPSSDKIPDADIVGVSVLLLRCKYNKQEFLNLGYFVSNEYEDEELKENPPSKPAIDKLKRTVHVDDLRVTAFPILWDENQTVEYPPEQDEPEPAEDDLMPLEDNAVEQDAEEEDAEPEGEGADESQDIELESDGEDEDQEEGEDDEAAEEEVDKATEKSSGDVEMTEAEENPEEPTLCSTDDAKNIESKNTEAPLADMTNGTAN